MSDLSVAVSFSLSLTVEEARLMKEGIEICDSLDVLTFDKDVAGLERAYEKRSPAFKSAFPRIDGNQDPFAYFRIVFEDPEYPVVNASIKYDAANAGANGRLPVHISSQNAELQALARLIQLACPSSLPTGFVFSCYSTANEVDAPNGGFALIQSHDVTLSWADNLLKQALAAIDANGTGSAPELLRDRPQILRFIDDHIRCEVDELIRELLTVDHAGSTPTLSAQAKALSQPFFDYRQAAIENGWKFEDGAWRGYNWDEFATWQEAEAVGRLESLRTAEDVCRENRLTAEQYAITGFYAVSPWLAEQLVARGERVTMRFSALHVWARWWEASIDLADDPTLNRIAAETDRYQ
ncbi:MAG: hypothetical protein DI537_10300 [Stutzerimonas stutzeri]|nr:MAG: hypothetical protein DI537_10300 [Stutzerimonas stutzeri]